MDDELMTALAELDEEEQRPEAVEAEEKFEREDKVAHKLNKSFEELESKMDRIELNRVLDKFDSEADENEKFLLDTVKSDLKTPEQALAAIKNAREKAAALRERLAAREAEIEKAAEVKAAKMWGIAPGSRPEVTDEERELMKRVESGDVSAAVAAIVGDDLPF